jgi:hypothetical protein
MHYNWETCEIQVYMRSICWVRLVHFVQVETSFRFALQIYEAGKLPTLFYIPRVVATL